MFLPPFLLIVTFPPTANSMGFFPLNCLIPPDTYPFKGIFPFELPHSNRYEPI